MAKRTDGKTKLTVEVRRRLSELAREARELLYGEEGCPAWGTSFRELESDAGEFGHELIRLLMEQASDEQSQKMPAAALKVESGEVAQLIGTEQRSLETESGPVQWLEPKANLPQSRKAFFPSEPGVGTEGG